MSVVAKFDLSPVYVEVGFGDRAVLFDPYEVRRMLAEAQSKPEAERWSTVRHYIGNKASLPVDEVTEEMAIRFNDYVVSIISQLDEDRKKKAAAIVSSLTSTTASPETSATGPTN